MYPAVIQSIIGLKFLDLFILYVQVFFLLVCICPSMHHVCSWCPWNPEVDVGAPGTGDKDGLKLPYGYWGLNTGPLEKN